MRRLSSDVGSLIGEIALPLLLLCVVDVGFNRVIARSADAPLPTLFPYPMVTAKYLAYRQLAGDGAPLDFLLMGMSQMIRANVGIVQDTVAAHGGGHIRGFNSAAPMLSVEFNRRLLEDVLVPMKAPRVLVHGFLPKNLLYEAHPAVVDATTHSLPVFAMHTGTPAAHVQNLVFEHSALMRYREVIRSALLFAPLPRDPSGVRLARKVDASGDVELNVRFANVQKLNPWERPFIEQFAKFDDLLQDTYLFDRLADLAKTCRDHGIQLVVLNNAVHPVAMQEFPHGRDDYDRFVAALRAAAEANGLPFLDAAPGGIGPPELFQDTVHHNTAGTRWLSERIAKFLLEQHLLPPHDATPASPTGS